MENTEMQVYVNRVRRLCNSKINSVLKENQKHFSLFSCLDIVECVFHIDENGITTHGGLVL